MCVREKKLVGVCVHAGSYFLERVCVCVLASNV
jgi:hypothetical protein